MQPDTRIAFALILIVTLILLFLPQAFAYETNAKQMILIDKSTGSVLESIQADTPMPPSSMSKLMTLYVLFDHVKQGKVKLDTPFHVSEKAWRKGGSKMFVKVNTKVSVEDLIRGIIVQSGNDACIVVAENIARTEEAFAELLNETAKRIGLKYSNFVNATGWPDEGHVMTARDLATLANRLLQDFPEFMPYFSETSYSYNNITQPNRNALIGEEGLGVDGLKTGHTEAGGYGIVLTSKHPENGRRLILVVNGLDSNKSRIAEGRSALQHGYNDFTPLYFTAENEPFDEIEVHYGADEKVQMVASQDLEMSLPNEQLDKIEAKIKYKAPVHAPVRKGDVLGALTISVDGDHLKSIALVANNDVERSSFMGRLFQNIGYGLSF